MQVKAYARPRPTRLAFLIEDDAESNAHLATAIAEAFARWGGRFSLVVPMRGGVISDAFMRWLTAYDPDALLAFTAPPENLVASLHRAINPLWLRGRQRRPDGEYYGPDLRVDGLSSLSVVPQVVGQGVPWGEQPRFIVDAFPQWRDDGFIFDNFGTLHQSMRRFPADPNLVRFLEPLTLIPPDAPADRYRFPKIGSDITSDVELLRRMTKRGGIFTLYDLAGRAAPEIVFQHPWASSFNLVVGDTFVDRVCFWNSYLLSEGWRRSGLTALRIPSARLKSAEFVDALREYINSHNFVGQSNSLARLTIRSYSVPLVELQAFETELRPALWSSTQVETIGGFDDCCPANPLERRYFDLQLEKDQELLPVPNGQLKLPRPKHIVEQVNIPTYMREGAWIVEVVIERHVNYSRFANVEHWWQLPKRTQVLRQFWDRRASRVTVGGVFGILANSSEKVTDVRIPEDDDVFAAMLHMPEGFPYGDLRHKEGIQVPFADSRCGDKGQYLIGVIELFGGLEGAIQYLGSHFWRNRFLSLAAPTRDSASRAAVVQRLQGRLARQQNAIRVDTEEEWGRLADATLSVAHGLRKPEAIVTFEQLRNAWHAELDAIRAAEPNVLGQEPNGNFDDELRASLATLRDLGVFAQGRHWRCRKCGHRNWSGLQRLANRMSCEICGNETAMPVEFQWHFQLNEFLATSLRDHDTLSLVWALGALRERADHCFAFLPPIELQRRIDPASDRFSSDAEIDLMCIVDGEFVIVEAKDAPRQFTATSIKKMEEVARGYLPDKIIIACMSEPDRIVPKVDSVRQSLGPLGIDVELMTLDEAAWNSRQHYLPRSSSVRIRIL